MYNTLVFEKDLQKLAREGLLRHVEDRLEAGTNPARTKIAGRELINFSLNDYLGLSRHPQLAGAASEAAIKYGAGAGSARLLAGGCATLHGELEGRIARFKGREAALIFGSGWHANAGAIPALAGEEDLILSDELNHASIIDGCRLSKAEVRVYKHADMDALRELLEGCKHGRKKLIITEAVFSMDGDIAPLSDIFELARKHNALVYVDEAHSIGVLGEGRGIREHLGLQVWNGLIEMGTFSKAFGSYGAFIAGQKEVTDLLVSRARTFMFSTAPPPASVAASLAALEMIESGKAAPLIKRLWENVNLLGAGIGPLLKKESAGSLTPITPVHMNSVEEALLVSAKLRENGVYVPAIRPPTVKTARLRVSVTASHSAEDIKRLLDALEKLI